MPKHIPTDDPEFAIAFWERVDRRSADECWPWRGHIDTQGYGIFTRKRVRYKAHRVAHILTHPGADQSLIGCHRCDNPVCVNPAHTYMGSFADNVLDACQRGRIKTGEESVVSKLTEEQVLAIYIDGRSFGAIGRQYGISSVHVRLLKHGKTWKHLHAIHKHEIVTVKRKAASILNESEAREILCSPLKRKVLAVRYGVCVGTVAAIQTGKTWRHLSR